jgi:putative transposase
MHAVLQPDDDHLFDLETARQREGQRILGLLGDLVKADYQYDLLREQARRVGVPSQYLWAWWHAYRERGIEGLLPIGWLPLDATSQNVVRQRLAILGELADAEEVTEEQILAIASDLEMSDRTRMRLFQRYRIGGLWGLAPHYNPLEAPSRQKRKRPPKRAAGTLDEAAFAEIDRRYQLLGEQLIKQVLREGKASRKAVRARAEEVGCSEKTLWNYLSAYREFGLQGLAPQERSDKGKSHIISPRMRNVIVGLCLPRRRRRSINKVHEEARRRARALGEPEPSKWQVRVISASIPKPDKLLAEGREEKFKSKYAITYSLAFLEEWNPQVILEIDHTQIDVLAKDIRSKKYRSKSGEIRPWLTLALERRSRLIMAAIFGYDRPDQYTVAAAIREAILVSDDKPYGGVPDIILVDNGKELLSHHVQHITQGLHIILRPCIRHQPQQKGKVERIFGTLNTRVWSDEPGYVDSNVQKRNPHARAERTIAQLEEKLRAFIAQYNNEVHSQLKGRTPLEYWNERCFADPIDERDLDPLLMKSKPCMANKIGIKYRGRLYWHRGLGGYVGKQVFVRAVPSYAAPDHIEVFDRDDWICTALAIDSEAGKAVTAADVRAAQREQREQAWDRIHAARDAVQQVDAEIAAREQQSAANGALTVGEEACVVSNAVTQQEGQASQAPQDEQKKAGRSSQDLLDVLGAHYETVQQV